MSKFVNKVKDAVRNFHLEQPGVGPGVGGQHGGIGANECYTSNSGHKWADNTHSPALIKGAANARPRPSQSTAGRTSSSS